VPSLIQPARNSNTGKAVGKAKGHADLYSLRVDVWYDMDVWYAMDGFTDRMDGGTRTRFISSSDDSSPYAGTPLSFTHM
jgi:hypothetical protein